MHSQHGYVEDMCKAYLPPLPRLWHNRDCIPSPDNIKQADWNVNRTAQAHQSPTHFFSSIIDTESKPPPPFKNSEPVTQCLLGASTPLSACLSSPARGREGAPGGFSVFCRSSAALFDLSNSPNEAGPLAGSWHTHTHTEGSGAEMCPQIAVSHVAVAPRLTQQPLP